MTQLEQLVEASRLYYELGETQSRVAELEAQGHTVKRAGG